MTFVSSGRVTADISGNVTVENPILTALTQRYTGTGTQTYIVGAGKKWIIIGYAVSQIGRIGIDNASATGQEMLLDTAYQGMQAVCPIVIPAGYKVIITKQGTITYYEVDA